MFCKNCGKEIDDHAAVCPHCGVVVNSSAFPASAPVQQNTIAIVGFILSLFTALIGLIVSCIGLKKSKELGGSGRGFAIAGIVIGAIEMVIVVIYIIAAVALVFGTAGSLM